MELSKQQQATVAAGLTVLSATVIIAFVLAVIWLIAGFLRVFSGVFLPLAVAGVLALVLKPYFEFFKNRKIHPILSLLIVYASVIVPLIAILWFFGALAVEQISELVGALKDKYGLLKNHIYEQWPAWHA